MIKKLTRFEVADIKAVAQRTSALRRKRESIFNKILALNEELNGLDHTIQRWEEPILGITEGLPSVVALEHIKDYELIINEDEAPNEETPYPSETEMPSDNYTPEETSSVNEEVEGNDYNPAE